MTKAQRQWMRQAKALVGGATIDHLKDMVAKDPHGASRLTALAKAELEVRGVSL